MVEFSSRQFDLVENEVEDILQHDIFVNNCENFVAGSLHDNAAVWSLITADSRVLDWIKNRVDITQFFAPFIGTFQVVTYAHKIPPPRQFSNSSNCKTFRDFINKEITSRLKSGAVSYIGPVGKVQPPCIVSPLTVEPT